MQAGHNFEDENPTPSPGVVGSVAVLGACTTRAAASFSAADLYESERKRRFELQEKLLEVVAVIQSRAPELNVVVREILLGDDG